MKKFLIATAATALMAAPAIADVATPTGDVPGRNTVDMQIYHENTVKISNEASGDRMLYINNDGTWSQRLPNGDIAMGTWGTQESQMCFTQVYPSQQPEVDAYCTESQTRVVGDTWVIVSPDGDEESVTLVEGRSVTGEHMGNVPGRKNQ